MVNEFITISINASLSHAGHELTFNKWKIRKSMLTVELFCLECNETVGLPIEVNI